MAKNKKPVIKGSVNGNAFVILGLVRKALKDAGQVDKVEEYTKKATSGDYNNLLKVSQEYVEFDLD